MVTAQWFLSGLIFAQYVLCGHISVQYALCSFAGSFILLGIVDVLADTRGYLNLTCCHSSAILQGQLVGHTYALVGIGRSVVLYIW